jgi:hypothetical protein
VKSLRPAIAAVIVIVGVRTISGQTTTADGVAALARGDYQRAVEILKPIADDWGTSDTAAQFFMAGLYEAGRGVSADPLRACALYLRAAGDHDNPFGRQAGHLFTAFSPRGQQFDLDCQLLAFVGFDHGFEPVMFDLGPRHTIEWTLTAATVTHDGRTKREEIHLAQPGARFLPLRHTELATGPGGTLTRTSSKCSRGTRWHRAITWGCTGISLKSSAMRSSASTPRTRSPSSKALHHPRATRST